MLTPEDIRFRGLCIDAVTRYGKNGIFFENEIFCILYFNGMVSVNVPGSVPLIFSNVDLDKSIYDDSIPGARRDLAPYFEELQRLLPLEFLAEI